MNDYLNRFSALLVQLDDQERDEVVEFYREYLLDAAIQEYDDCVAELGTPKQLARKVLADYSIRFNENLTSDTSKTQRSKAGVRTIWWIILALISTPITIPVLLVVLLALFVLGVLAFAALVTIAGLVFGAAIVAIGMIAAGVAVFTQSIWVAIFYLGCGFTILGAGLLLFPLVVWFISILIQGVSRLAQNLYHRVVKKNRAERGGRHHEKNH